MISNEAKDLIEMLSKTINQRGQRESKAGFITRDEALSLLRKNTQIITLRLTTPADEDYHCFIDDHLYGFLDVNNHLEATPISSSLPMRITARQKVPDGNVITLEDYESVYLHDSKLINDFEEFIDFIIEHQLYTMNNKIRIY